MEEGPVGPGGTISLKLEGADGVPATEVTAVVLNVTATDPTASSYVTVYPDGGNVPNASTLNFTAGETIPNLVVVPVGADGEVDFYNDSGSTDLVADMAGYYTAGGAPWADAIEMPGVAALGAVGGVGVSSLSCSSPGNCAAAGPYAPTTGQDEVYVVSEVNGVWGDDIEVPDIAALNAGGNAEVTSVSCASAGNCAAGGYYFDGSGDQQAFVVDEVNGTWGDAIEVPGTAALNTGQGAFAELSSVSCPSAGNCTAGGYTSDASSHVRAAFVVDETDGVWGDAIVVPGTATVNTDGWAAVNSVSCSSAGNCAAGGYYVDTSYQSFVDSEVNGLWGDAIEVPGTAAATDLADDGVNSVSCSSDGNCAAGGSYLDVSGAAQAYVVSEVGGYWGDAAVLPFTNGSVSAVLCPSDGNCTADGTYEGPYATGLPFVIGEVNGTWGNPIEVPGTAGLSDSASLVSLSCSSAGSCVAGGSYLDGVTDTTQAFLVSEVNGIWGEAIEVPGAATFSAGGIVEVTSVSCPPAGECTAVGDYGGSTTGGVFVVSQN